METQVQLLKQMVDKDKTSKFKQNNPSEACFCDNSKLLNQTLQPRDFPITKINSTSRVHHRRTYLRAKWVLHLTKPWVAHKESKWFQNKQWQAKPRWVNLIKEWLLLSKTSKLTRFLNRWWIHQLHWWVNSKCQLILLMANQISLITRWKTSECERKKISWTRI